MGGPKKNQANVEGKKKGHDVIFRIVRVTTFDSGEEKAIIDSYQKVCGVPERTAYKGA